MPTRRHERRRETFVTGNLVVAIGRELFEAEIFQNACRTAHGLRRIKEKER